jgi:hypothetical protein
VSHDERSPAFFIPGVGWDTPSIVSGYIRFAGAHLLPAAVATIAAYPFDDVYPFTNIFAGGSPAAYGAGVIGFAGSYKQVEEEWGEWLWKFADLLSRLDADEAHVGLDGVLGSHRWTLEPEAGGTRQWAITRAPAEDFSIHPEWLAHFDRGWRRFVPRRFPAAPAVAPADPPETPGEAGPRLP